MQDEPDVQQAEFEVQFEILRLQYLAGLPARRLALLAAWRECGSGADEQAWQRLRDAAHNLSGSAPCYGLEALGKLARRLDRQLSGAAACRERAIAEKTLRGLVAALDAAIAAS